MSIGDYYKQLNLPETASQEEIKRAYRRLRAKYHPDRNKGRESNVEPIFKRIQEAFEVLTGTRAAAQHAPSGTQEASRHAQARQPQSHRTDDRDARKPWSTTANRWQAYRSGEEGPPQRGANRHDKLYVPLEAALNGGHVPTSYQVTAPCKQCRGMSARFNPGRCAACDGQGKTANGARCGTCGGSGRANVNRCAACQNTGSESYWKTDQVTVPAGAWDGQQLTVSGSGFPGSNGGAAGDAILSVVILCGSDIRRDGLNLVSELKVDFVTATLGGPFDTHLFGRDMRIAVPPNSAQGSVIRLAAHGLSDAAGNRGELRLDVVLAMPDAAAHLTDEQREQLKAMFDEAARRGAS
ncbi:DnaJ C-terminal domain-containing protein [Paraburkholderia rhizosphaerae]|uniref:Molecular chaperone DnaJ n=1 Tax=Paraburkholderia rhizosphaerae TaxID=480658 RepID=A0A4R8M205_9BURK|nr:DnaJ C-terminal domain-containing protein [Paraburkholderia rhizosphaerae]TDY54170.1 molecular chaperone DnaJ [Paraburkholderia rhizosphaerae]